MHCDARSGEELTDLGGVLNNVQRQAADNHREQHPVVSMGAREWPSGHLLGEAVKGLAYAPAAPVDEQLSRPVDQDRLGSFGLGFPPGPLDEFAVDEGRPGADQGDEVGCVDGAPAVLG